MSSAQADFRANDRDGNKVPAFWRKDIAGLYALRNERDLEENPDTAEPIALIELSIAAADDRPAVDIATYSNRDSKAGYWYRALRFADEDKEKPDPQRFAALAYPDSIRAGKTMYVVDHTNTVYRKPFDPEAIPEVFPTDLAADGWLKMD